ncbi:MAG: LptF/LptG family permease [Planctomycetota bacterium]
MNEPSKTPPELRARPGLLLVLHRYVLADLFGTLCLAFGIVMGLMFLFLSLEAARRAGVDAASILLLAPHAIPFGLKYALPVALLLAVTFTFSRLAADNEITALRAAGSSLWPLVTPVILVSLLLSLCLLCVTMVWLPRAHIAKRKILRGAGLNVLSNLPPGEFQFQFGRVRLSYASADGANRVMNNVFVSEVREGKLHMKITARQARWEFDQEANLLHLELRQSQWTMFGKGGESVQKVYPDVVPFRLDLENLFPSRPPRMQDYSLSQLLGLRELVPHLPAFAHPKMYRWKPCELDYEIHNRFAESFSPLIMALLGMPLGVLVRQRGKLVAFFAGFLPVVAFYYPLTLAGLGLGTSGALDPALAAWAPTVLVGILGAVLTARMITK